MVRAPEPVWRNAPRHVPEMALPPYAYIPGRTPHPVNDPDGHMHDKEAEGGFLRGIDLYHAGYLWEAHEAWEGLWKSTSDPVQREFLQALIQIAAALLKAHVGEETGARKLAAAARSRFQTVVVETPNCMGLDVTGLLRQIDACFAAEIEWNCAPRLEMR